MPGKNLLLKNSQVLFHAGENSNGMYIVRTGKLEVYLEKNSKKTTLAMVETGGMIGEMALFDQKPRSASVRAMQDSEVTHITNDDFASLMKQIPKWFTSLMGTLSGRLRATNLALQESTARLEQINGGPLPPAAATATPVAPSKEPEPKGMQEIMQMLFVADLVFQKGGNKEGAGAKGSYKSFSVNKSEVYEAIEDIFAVPAKSLDQIFAALDAEKFVTIKGEKNAQTLSVENKHKLGRFNKYFKTYVKMTRGVPLNDTAMEMIKVIETAVEKSAYDVTTISIDELRELALKQGIKSTEQWQAQIPALNNCHDDLKTVKTSNGSPGFKVQKSTTKDLLLHHTIIRALAKVKLL